LDIAKGYGTGHRKDAGAKVAAKCRPGAHLVGCCQCFALKELSLVQFSSVQLNTTRLIWERSSVVGLFVLDLAALENGSFSSSQQQEQQLVVFFCSCCSSCCIIKFQLHVLCLEWSQDAHRSKGCSRGLADTVDILQ